MPLLMHGLDNGGFDAREEILKRARYRQLLDDQVRAKQELVEDERRRSRLESAANAEWRAAHDTWEKAHKAKPQFAGSGHQIAYPPLPHFTAYLEPYATTASSVDPLPRELTPVAPQASLTPSAAQSASGSSGSGSSGGSGSVTSAAPAIDPQLVETLLDELLAQGKALRRLQLEVRDLRACVDAPCAPARDPPPVASVLTQRTQPHAAVARMRAYEDQLDRLVRSVDDGRRRRRRD